MTNINFPNDSQYKSSYLMVIIILVITVTVYEIFYTNFNIRAMFGLQCQPTLRTWLRARLWVPGSTTAMPCWPVYQSRTCTIYSSYRIHWRVLSPEPFIDMTLLRYTGSCIGCWFERASRSESTHSFLKSNSHANRRTSPILSGITNVYANSGRLQNYY